MTTTTEAAAGTGTTVKKGPLGLLSGIALTAALAGTAFGLRQLPGVGFLSPMILAILLGLVLHNIVGTPVIAKAGVQFSMRRLLRLAIILLGLQLTSAQLVAIGAGGLAVIVLSLAATFMFTVWLGRAMGVDRGLAELIAAGTSICGASAVIATNTVTRASDEDAAYALACVTLFGSLAMFLYPLMPVLLDLGPRAYGLWAGASIHEIAQVVAAAFQGGREAGEVGTVSKLARVIALGPLVMLLAVLARRRAIREGGDGPHAHPPLPWFVLGFIALVCVNSVISIPEHARAMLMTLTSFLMSMALAAMGLEADIRKLRAKGLRPLALGAAATLFIATLSLVCVKMLG